MSLPNKTLVQGLDFAFHDGAACFVEVDGVGTGSLDFASVDGVFFGVADGFTSYGYVASGGLQSAGSSELLKGKVFAAEGGTAVAGSAVTSMNFVSTVGNWTASGGIQSGGIAEVLKGKCPEVAGGVVGGGAAATQFISGLAGSGAGSGFMMVR